MLKSTGKLTLAQRAIHLIHRIDPDHALNSTPMPPDPVAALAAQLTDALVAIKTLFYHHHTFDYAGLQASVEYQACRALLTELQRFDPISLTTADARRAFWINLYNVLIINAAVAFGVRTSALEVGGFFSRAAYGVNGYRFSANDIEHGVLRGNAGHPLIPGPQFRRGDPRLKVVLPLDPRIHFALNCAAISCPPIAAYAAGQLDQQLDRAARAFINNGGAVLGPQQRTLSLSRIFYWYADDFAGKRLGSSRKAALLGYVARYLEDANHKQALLEAPGGFRITYQKYHWALNTPDAGGS